MTNDFSIIYDSMTNKVESLKLGTTTDTNAVIASLNQAITNDIVALLNQTVTNDFMASLHVDEKKMNSAREALRTRESEEPKNDDAIKEIMKRVYYDSAETGLRLIQGIQFSTSSGIDDQEKLLEDGNYFLQLYYTEQLSDRWNIAFSVSYGKSFFATNAPALSTLTTQPNTDKIIKADAIGLKVHPKLILNQHNWDGTDILKVGGLKPGERSYMYTRADIGGVIAQSKDENIDEEFKFESDVVLGFESLYGSRFMLAEIGCAYYERLPDDKLRSVARVAYGYYLGKPSSTFHGRLLLFTEFSGMEHKEAAEAKVFISYELDPEHFFKGIF